jgi:hypothetical protein
MTFRIILSSCAALALAACGGQPADKAAGTETAAKMEEAPAKAEAATESVAAATPAAGAAPTREFMVGKWGESGDCVLAFTFNADGSITDGPADRWELAGNELTLVGMPQKMVLSVVDDKTMESRLDGTGSPRKLTRC